MISMNKSSYHLPEAIVVFIVFHDQSPFLILHCAMQSIGNKGHKKGQPEWPLAIQYINRYWFRKFVNSLPPPNLNCSTIKRSVLPYNSVFLVQAMLYCIVKLVSSTGIFNT